ncbi:MauE/DoxX family redox-associated membrane protein [Thermopolyspora sp. NPDC052614]|uniref:MauE/DoxX family redox-associated membrane protein n=1 Tax=Thermopolyspora sp. NPDC052614 TaxID=3155682 RepID=UPI0034289328
MPYVLLGCQIMVGTVFLASVAGKVRGRRAYSAFLAAIGGLAPGLPPSRRQALAPLMIAGESAVAALLAVPVTARAGFVAAVVLLAVFTVAITAAIRARRRVSCACFWDSSVAVGPAQLIRNGVLLACSLTGAVLGPGAWSAAPEPGGVAAAALAGLAGAGLVILTDDIAALFRPLG